MIRRIARVRSTQQFAGIARSEKNCGSEKRGAIRWYREGGKNCESAKHAAIRWYRENIL